MSAFDQAELFEPTGAAVGELAMKHAQRAEGCDRTASVAKSRGWWVVEIDARRAAKNERNEAECLAMLADFERLGGVT